MSLKLSIILPVYNELATIGELLERVWQEKLPGIEREMVVVESNSSDGTREVVESFAREKNAIEPGSVLPIHQTHPKGKGFAVREGMQHATGDIILIQDGDLEYDVADYASLLEPIIQGKAEFVLGSRHLSANTWKIRAFKNDPVRSFILNLGGVFFHGLFNLLYGQRLTDPTTMYKVFRRSCSEQIHFVSNRFDFDFELLGKLIRAGYVPFEVPVSYRSRGFDAGKKIRMFRDPLLGTIAIIRFRFGRLKI